MIIDGLVLLAAVYAAFQIGRRWEVGRRELEADRIEVDRERRSKRGTVKLNTMRIRR